MPVLILCYSKSVMSTRMTKNKEKQNSMNAETHKYSKTKMPTNIKSRDKKDKIVVDWAF